MKTDPHQNEQIPPEWLAALLDFLERFLPLSEEFKASLPNYLRLIRFDSITTVLHEGEVAEQAYWIQAGGARGYRDTTDREGLPKQETVAFWMAKLILSVSDSFFNRVAAKHHVEFAAGSAVLAISRQLFDALKAEAPEAGELATKLIAQHYNETLERAQLLGLDAAERKEACFARHGHEINRYFRQKDIASYLGMEPETFSRLKAIS